MKNRDYTMEFEQAKRDARKYDKDDILSIGSKYFTCGYEKKEYCNGCFYNESIAIAFEIVGKFYGDSQNRNSNYHKGIAYIAEKLHINKRQIKVLRKKFSKKDAYVFRTPYVIYDIISCMIELISEKENEPIVKQYLYYKKNHLYRDILIAKQYLAIIAASKRNQEVEQIYGKLATLTKQPR